MAHPARAGRALRALARALVAFAPLGLTTVGLAGFYGDISPLDTRSLRDAFPPEDRGPRPGASVLASALASAFAPVPVEPGRVLAPASAHRPALVYIPAGSFPMGSDAAEPGHYPWESPVHDFGVDALEMCATEVTQAQYRATVGTLPSECDAGGVGCGDDYPVNSISWFDAVHYLNALSRREGLTPCYRVLGDDVLWDRGCAGYRLPTEGEWEYATRAGDFGARVARERDAAAYAWFDDTDDTGRPHAVARKQPNPWGLYDVLGNVEEWCWDRIGSYELLALQDRERERARLHHPGRVVRGGGIDSDAASVRAAARLAVPPRSRVWRVGMRCVKRSRVDLETT